MIIAYPSPSDIVNANGTSTATGIITVPAGRWLTANVQISAHLTGVGPATPRVIYTVPGGATNAAPPNASVVAELHLGGTLGVSVQDSNTTDILVYGGDAGGPSCTLDFNSGSATGVSYTISGFLI